MKPYYEEPGITIYHGDCRDGAAGYPPSERRPHGQPSRKPASALRELPQQPDQTALVGCPQIVCITDPPYGIAHPTNYKSRGRGRLAQTSDFVPVFGDNEPFDPSIWAAMPSILWGANYYSDRLPPSSGWLLWDKRVQEGKGVNDQADGEMAWSNFVKGVRIFRHMWNGFWRDSERGESYHPTQKPVALMVWCMSLPWTPLGTILDPFMGSGTTLVAAKRLGRRAIGIEIEEKYCEIAVRRIQEASMPLLDALEPQQFTIEA